MFNRKMSNFDEKPSIEKNDLNDEEILKLQFQIIDDWPNKRETWALRNSSGILGAMSALSGIYINYHYRSKLKLGNYGRLSSYLPIVALPAIVSSFYHKTIIQPEIMLEEKSCPLCFQIRASLFQGTFAVIYPTILAPIASFMFASRHFTYRLPSITENPKELMKLWQKMTRPISLVLTSIFIGQYFVCTLLTYKEMVAFHNIMIKLEKHSKKLENTC